MVGDEGIRKQIIGLIETIEDSKLDLVLAILHNAIDDSDKIKKKN